MISKLLINIYFNNSSLFQHIVHSYSSPYQLSNIGIIQLNDHKRTDKSNLY